MIKWYREGRFPIDKMMKLIKAEDFEQAAVLRDEIKQTTARLSSPAP